jgi:tetratricopeptide (TPR) repeat protein
MWLTELRAIILMLRGRIETAIPLFEKILESHPIYPGALGLVLEHYRQKGDRELVRRYAERALVEDATNFRALDALAWAYITQGQHAMAKPVVERAIRSAEILQRTPVPHRLVMRVLIAIVGPGLALWRGRNPAQAPTAEMIWNEGKSWFKPWKQWADRYLDWHSQVYDTDVSGKEPR